MNTPGVSNLEMAEVVFTRLAASRQLKQPWRLMAFSKENLQVQRRRGFEPALSQVSFCCVWLSHPSGCEDFNRFLQAFSEPPGVDLLFSLYSGCCPTRRGGSPSIFFSRSLMGYFRYLPGEGHPDFFGVKLHLYNDILFTVII